MSTYGNNHARNEITEFREEHLTEERLNKFNELMQDKEEEKIHKKLTLENSENLYNRAQEILKELEKEELTDEAKAKLERQLTHLLVAIQDTESVDEKCM